MEGKCARIVQTAKCNLEHGSRVRARRGKGVSECLLCRCNHYILVEILGIRPAIFLNHERDAAGQVGSIAPGIKLQGVGDATFQRNVGPVDGSCILRNTRRKIDIEHVAGVIDVCTAIRIPASASSAESPLEINSVPSASADVTGRDAIGAMSSMATTKNEMNLDTSVFMFFSLIGRIVATMKLSPLKYNDVLIISSFPYYPPP